MSEKIPTEAVLESARELDERSLEEILSIIHAEDRRAVAAIGRVLPELACAVEMLADVLRAGGRWFNLGAGTSGRMGAIDAAELPPTFGTEPDQVQAVLAGGPEAFLCAREGAEDDAQGARRELKGRGLCARDAVVVISASGRTRFALGGLRYAREIGAQTATITCDPGSPIARDAHIVIAPVVGPEVIAGSTRMKGGLVQKMALHLLSTAVMVKLGRVEGNLMASLRPGSEKLRLRALSIVMTLCGVDAEVAGRALEAAGGSVSAALAALRD